MGAQRRSALAVAVALGFAGSVPLAAGLGAAPAAATSPGPGAYQNPLLADDAPDPDIVESAGTYYAFTTLGPTLFSPSTDSFQPIQLFTSTDLATWTRVPGTGPLGAYPPWSKDAQIGYQFDTWAPSVAQIGGTWVMYYAIDASYDGVHCLAVATSNTVAGP
jgi:beta-xylosidase